MYFTSFALYFFCNRLLSAVSLFSQIGLKFGTRKPFIDCLDYIFLSRGWKVASVLELPRKDETAGPFPVEKEPSDHILLSAELQAE